MGISKKIIEQQKQERLGENNISNEGYEMKIIEYNKANDIIVEFQDKHRVKVHTQYSSFKSGNVKNPYHKSVFNIGYLGQGEYKISRNGKHTKAYIYWRHMLKRNYDPYLLNKYPTYRDCYVCDEWLCFQNFAKWFYKNYYEVEGERMCLDKDILIKNNKLYSPSTCIIVPERINTLFIKQQRKRGEYPIGVYPYYNKKSRCKTLTVQCRVLEKENQEYLGCFPLSEPFHAFYTYKQFKENYIKQVADEYKDLIPTKLYEAMYKYEVEIND